MGPDALAQVLCGLPKQYDPNLLVGYDTSDDASVYRISDDLALVQTVDFFPPMVDDPYLFGQIAAANSLSDIYAMGATPKLAMNLLCCPTCLSPDTLRAILAGGADKAAEAGAILSGGHTIQDAEPKYGLCVTGFVHPARVLANRGSRPGDVLILTKPLGIGILTTAAKADLITPEQFLPAANSMAFLNRTAAESLTGLTVSACTDVTGFGLLGHACEMAGEDVTLRLFADALPLLPQTRELAEMGILPAGVYTNLDFLANKVFCAPTVPRALHDISADPQTSGGLLIALPESDAKTLLSRLHDANIPAKQIGEVCARTENAVILT